MSGLIGLELGLGEGWGGVDFSGQITAECHSCNLDDFFLIRLWMSELLLERSLGAVGWSVLVGKRSMNLGGPGADCLGPKCGPPKYCAEALAPKCVRP